MNEKENRFGWCHDISKWRQFFNQQISKCASIKMSYSLYGEYQNTNIHGYVISLLHLFWHAQCAMCGWNWININGKTQKQNMRCPGPLVEYPVCSISQSTQLLLFTSIDFNFSAAITSLPTHHKSMWLTIHWFIAIWNQWKIVNLPSFDYISPTPNSRTEKWMKNENPTMHQNCILIFYQCDIITIWIVYLVSTILLIICFRRWR